MQYPTFENFGNSQKGTVQIYFCCKTHFILTFQNFYLGPNFQLEYFFFDYPGPNFQLRPLAYTLRNGGGTVAACLTGWVLEGSQDVNGVCVCAFVCVWV